MGHETRGKQEGPGYIPRAFASALVSCLLPPVPYFFRYASWNATVAAARSRAVFGRFSAVR